MVGVSECAPLRTEAWKGTLFRESWKAANRPDKAVSLIEEETLEAAAAELGTDTLATRAA
jgi:hypothetical protein